MEEDTVEILKKVALVLIILVIATVLYLAIFRSAETVSFFAGTGERFDIVVSDRVPAGCFIPPDSGEAVYNAITGSNNDEIKKASDICFKYGESGFGGLSGPKLVKWSDMSQIQYGVKLDGYCMDNSRDNCLSLSREITTFEKNDQNNKDETPEERRSIDFGPESEMTLGNALVPQKYTTVNNPPSVFVVSPGNDAKLSIYAGVRINGNKTVEKISASIRLGNQNSCFFGKSFDCYKEKKNSADCKCSENMRAPDESSLKICENYAEYAFEKDDIQKGSFKNGCAEADLRKRYQDCLSSGKGNCESLCPACVQKFKDIDYNAGKCGGLDGKELEGCSKFYAFEDGILDVIGNEKSCYAGVNFKCFQASKDPEKCGCSESVRYIDESPLEVCNNFAASAGKGGEFKDGCLEGYARGEYLSCSFLGKSSCEERCADCPDIFKSAGDLENKCNGLDGDKKSGCEQLFTFQKNVFRIEPSNYTIVKIGDITIPNGYRGTAFASAGVTFSRELPGVSCYSPKLFGDYETCCLETCNNEDEEGKKDCKKLGCTSAEEEPTTASIATTTESTQAQSEKSCAEKYNCSVTKNVETDDRYLLCKNFCESHDAYYGEPESVQRCTEGCDWAKRMESEQGTSEIKSIGLVFIVDTSTSMDNEWKTLCDEISKIKRGAGKDNVPVNSAIYALGDEHACSIPTQKLDCPKLQKVTPSLKCDNINCRQESWGPAAEWAIRNYEWSENSLGVVIVISDEGPYCGGDKSVASGVPGSEGYFDDADDTSSVTNAANAATSDPNHKFVIYGLWGDDAQKNEGLQKMFSDISTPTGGEAKFFGNGADLSSLLENIMGRGEAFEKGYGKYIDLSKKENRVSPDKPYYLTQAYQNIYSNLVYIVDWKGGGEWSYPGTGADGKPDYNLLNMNKNSAGKIVTKPVKVSMLDKLQDIYSQS